MSVTPAGEPGAAEAAASDRPAQPAGSPCPRCGAALRDDQSWCLECGLAARTRLAPTPNWRLPLGVAAGVALAALAALVVAFLVVTSDNAPVPPPTTAAPPAAAPAAAPPAATTPPPATTPATGTPTTTIPPATVPATPPQTTPVAPTGAG